MGYLVNAGLLFIMLPWSMVCGLFVGAVMALQAYSNRDRSDGFVDANILITDDGAQVVVVTRFASREQYWALADSSNQDDWYQTTMAPMLDGDPTWIDGAWSD